MVVGRPPFCSPYLTFRFFFWKAFSSKVGPTKSLEPGDVEYWLWVSQVLQQVQKAKCILIAYASGNLGLQIPSKKVLKLLKRSQSIFLEGIWSPIGHTNV